MEVKIGLLKINTFLKLNLLLTNSKTKLKKIINKIKIISNYCKNNLGIPQLNYQLNNGLKSKVNLKSLILNFLNGFLLKIYAKNIKTEKKIK